jgi:Protein of unknown function (DUF992)
MQAAGEIARHSRGTSSAQRRYDPDRISSTWRTFVMRFGNICGAGIVVAVAVAVSSSPSLSKSGINVGVLQCTVEGGVGLIVGSSKDVTCSFNPGQGSNQRYTGTITKIGIDVGVTAESALAWLVFAPGSVDRGSLEGRYGGVSAEATVAAGLGANVLVGALERSIALQPLSIQGQTGLNLAVGISGLRLRFDE